MSQELMCMNKIRTLWIWSKIRERFFVYHFFHGAHSVCMWLLETTLTITIILSSGSVKSTILVVRYSGWIRTQAHRVSKCYVVLSVKLQPIVTDRVSRNDIMHNDRNDIMTGMTCFVSKVFSLNSWNCVKSSTGIGSTLQNSWRNRESKRQRRSSWLRLTCSRRGSKGRSRTVWWKQPETGSWKMFWTHGAYKLRKSVRNIINAYHIFQYNHYNKE